MNKNNAGKWQEVISKPQRNKQLKKPAFVKVSTEKTVAESNAVTLNCGGSKLIIPVGTNVQWLGALLNELST